MVINPRYRGKGVLMALFEFVNKRVAILGHPAYISRIAITGRNAVPNIVTGTQFVGLIPKSLKVTDLVNLLFCPFCYTSPLCDFRSVLRPNPHRTRDATRAQIGTFFL